MPTSLLPLFILGKVPYCKLLREQGIRAGRRPPADQVAIELFADLLDAGAGRARSPQPSSTPLASAEL